MEGEEYYAGMNGIGFGSGGLKGYVTTICDEASWG